MGRKFRALVIEEAGEGFVRRIVVRDTDALPPGDLLVRVRYSSLNYKDALSATGHKGVTRHYPHTPGIDAAGEVVECRDGRYRPGEAVIVHGRDLGMNTPGGFGQYIRVPSDWALPLPEGLTLREAMVIGTAGFTAAHCVLRIMSAGVTPGQGDVLVTGATGGVGSFAVAILAREGFRVVASTGKPGAAAFLKELGAAEIIPRAETQDPSGRPLLKGRWAAAVDCVGGSTLSTAIRSTRYGGAVACCGLTESPGLALTVYPFILRGVSLLGIDSAECPETVRKELWERLAGPWKPELPRLLGDEVDLSGLDGKIRDILQGRLRGRTVVRPD